MISVDVKADQEEVVRMVKKYDLVNIPVVDGRHRLVGRITHDDIMDVIEEEADEDISFMAGVMDQEESLRNPSKISKARIPWLMVGLSGEMVAALVIHQFGASISRMVALTFFFPVIMAMGGNTGTQAATVVVRGLATGEISLMNVGKRLWTELRVAFINGAACGILLGLIAGTWLSDYLLGLTMALSLVLIILWSGFIGSAVPFALKRLGFDPALATGPFVSTSNDVLGLLIYLGFVTLFFRLGG